MSQMNWLRELAFKILYGKLKKTFTNNFLSLYNKNTMSKILLASKSPRRKELLKEIFPTFDIIAPDVDENVAVISPEDRTIAIAERKAFAVKNRGITIGADTVVYLDGTYFGKPKDYDDAFKILSTLSGKAHEVYTGVCIRFEDLKATFSVKTQVQFKNLSPEEINFYIKNYSPLDKAGGYGIQDNFCVEKINGSLSNVIGLPIEKLKEVLKALKAI